MSRHRNVQRSLKYDDEDYDYDEVYGHSVEDDYGVSPGTSQYVFDRSRQSNLGLAFPSEDNIEEEPEDEPVDDVRRVRQRMNSLTIENAVASLGPEDVVRLKSCLETIQDSVGDFIPESQIKAAILKCDFNCERALNECLTSTAAMGAPKLEVSQPQPSTKMEVDDKVHVPQEKELPAPPPTVTIASATAVVSTPDAVKVVSAAKKTLGFDIPATRSGATTPVPTDVRNTMKSPSPTPMDDSINRTPKPREFKPELALREYEKERGGEKVLINLLVIGHVDAGKSTLMGHLLFDLGHVAKRTMHKFEQESKKLGKQSFTFAWVLDETDQERSRGITMDVGRSKFETESKTVVLLDAPGHKDFIPNMITGASQADVAILVVDSTTGEFETGFESGGQTREHAILVRSLGVTQLAVAVNKLDTVGWSEERFLEIKSKLTSFLTRQAGFRESDLTFVPCSGLVGENLVNPPQEATLTAWYKGQTLLQAIDSFRSPERPVGKPLRVSVGDIFKGPGGLCIGGRVETGMVQPMDKVLIQPLGETATVKSITIEETGGTIAFAGDPVLLTLQGVADQSTISAGFVLSDPHHPAKVSSRFTARVVTFDSMEVPLTRGFFGVLHIGSMSEQVVVKKLINQLHRSNGEVIKLKPRCLGKSSNGTVLLETTKPICLEEFKDVRELGRFTLRTAGVTIAAGVVVDIL